MKWTSLVLAVLFCSQTAHAHFKVGDEVAYRDQFQALDGTVISEVKVLTQVTAYDLATGLYEVKHIVTDEDGMIDVETEYLGARDYGFADGDRFVTNCIDYGDVLEDFTLPSGSTIPTCKSIINVPGDTEVTWYARVPVIGLAKRVRTYQFNRTVRDVIYFSIGTGP